MSQSKLWPIIPCTAWSIGTYVMMFQIQGWGQEPPCRVQEYAWAWTATFYTDSHCPGNHHQSQGGRRLCPVRDASHAQVDDMDLDQVNLACRHNLKECHTTADMIFCCKDDMPHLPEHCPSGLPQCKTQLSACYHDVLPPPSPAITVTATSDLSISGDTHMETTSIYTLPTNSFGIYQVYSSGALSYLPDDDFNLENIAVQISYDPLPHVLCPHW
jgi:hypothetical protein